MNVEIRSVSGMRGGLGFRRLRAQRGSRRALARLDHKPRETWLEFEGPLI